MGWVFLNAIFNSNPFAANFFLNLWEKIAKTFLISVFNLYFHQSENLFACISDPK